MAITIDTTTTGSSDPSSATLTWSHTCTDATLLVVTVAESRAVTVTGVTYNGDALTLAIEDNTGTPYASIWYRVNPDAGAHDIVVTYSSAITVPRAGGASFKGTDTSSPLGATANESGSAAAKSIDITTTMAGSAVIDCVGDLGTIHTPASGQTTINTDGNNRIGGYEIVGATGTYSQNWNSNDSISRAYCHVAAEFKEPASGPTKLKTWNGLTNTKIKTINGLAIAKVKTINGLT